MTEKKNKGGRPTKFKKEYIDLAYNYCLLGATDDDLADFFGVDVSTIGNWKVAHPEFYQTLQDGKKVADMKVAQSLFKKATGYEHEAVKIFNDQGKPLIVPYTERYAPDTTAAIFWLKNRRPSDWRDKTEVEQKSVVVNVSADMSPTDAERAYKELMGQSD